MKPCPLCGAPGGHLFCTAQDRDQPGQSWQVWRCGCCLYGWTLPEISPERLAGYYPPVYLGDTRRTLQQYRQGRLQKSRSWRRETNKVRLLERFIRQGKILDVGCAGAGFLLALDPVRWRRHGVETIAEVANLVREAAPDLALLVGGVDHPDLQESSFDVITFWHVLEHLRSPRRVLERVRRLLRPGGWLLMEVPNFDSLQARIFRSHWYAFDLPRHLHHFSPAVLRRLLEESGFRFEGWRFFSPHSNFHQLKHSTIHWAQSRFSSRLPYYLLKPLLFPFQWMDRIWSKPGTITVIARTPDDGVASTGSGRETHPRQPRG